MQLSHQCNAVSDGIAAHQAGNGVPAHRLMALQTTATTRWGNQFKQVATNCVLRPVIDAVVSQYKRDNRGKKDAIVEMNEAESGSKVGKEIAAIEIGLDEPSWDQSIELESFLEYPFKIKESIEFKGYLTGAQSAMLLGDLKQGCSETKSLEVALCPTTSGLAGRDARTLETREHDSLYGGTQTARAIMSDEISQRMFGERPSNLRLVQMYMSKQRRPESWLPSSWLILAKTLYLAHLRKASLIAGTAVRTSPRKKADGKQVDRGLFRNLDEEDEANTGTAGSDAEEYGSDPVFNEVTQWKNLDRNLINKHKDKDGLVNEFALLYEVRLSFPLHYILFRQTASHIAHEANSERLFSLSGRLADPNMDPKELGIFAKLASNASVYKPSYDAILQRYMDKFSKQSTGGQLEQVLEYTTSAMGD